MTKRLGDSQDTEVVISIGDGAVFVGSGDKMAVSRTGHASQRELDCPIMKSGVTLRSMIDMMDVAARAADKHLLTETKPVIEI